MYLICFYALMLLCNTNTFKVFHRCVIKDMRHPHVHVSLLLCEQCNINPMTHHPFQQMLAFSAVLAIIMSSSFTYSSFVPFLGFPDYFTQTNMNPSNRGVIITVGKLLQVWLLSVKTLLDTAEQELGNKILHHHYVQ